MSPIPLGYFATAGGGAAAAPGSYELIASAYGNGGSNTISLSSIPSTFKHLQVRFHARIAADTSGRQLYINVNSDTNGNYSTHAMVGSGSGSVYASNGTSNVMDSVAEIVPGSQESSGLTGAGIIDILDYTSNSKYKTFRMMIGKTSTISTNIYTTALVSGNWRSTSAINSLTFTTSGPGNFTSLTRFSLYGIKGE